MLERDGIRSVAFKDPDYEIDVTFLSSPRPGANSTVALYSFNLSKVVRMRVRTGSSPGGHGRAAERAGRLLGSESPLRRVLEAGLRSLRR